MGVLIVAGMDWGGGGGGGGGGGEREVNPNPLDQNGGPIH